MHHFAQPRRLRRVWFHKCQARSPAVLLQGLGHSGGGEGTNHYLCFKGRARTAPSSRESSKSLHSMVHPDARSAVRSQRSHPTGSPGTPARWGQARPFCSPPPAAGAAAPALLGPAQVPSASCSSPAPVHIQPDSSRAVSVLHHHPLPLSQPLPKSKLLHLSLQGPISSPLQTFILLC